MQISLKKKEWPTVIRINKKTVILKVALKIAKNIQACIAIDIRFSWFVRNVPWHFADKTQSFEA